jgi:2'-hydroxyisoflavone reductase
MNNRREFLRVSALLGGAALTRGVIPNVDLSRLVLAQPAPRALKVLVLGGTGFIGPHLVRHLVARGHTVSIFTRGRRQADLPESVERLVGDRDAKDANGNLAGDYTALADRRWDFVFDDSANNPAWVQQSTQVLRNATTRYLFVSSTGVFYPYRTVDITESTPVRMSMTEEAADSFGVNKSIAEARTREVFGDRAIVVRPTYIVGPGDGSDRFTYWPVRLARGGEVLAPGKPTDRSQFVDVRDLAEFMVHIAESGANGTFNVAGPKETLTFPEFLTKARAAINTPTTLTWVDDYDFLTEQKLTFACPWGLPRGDVLGMMAISPAKAIASGLKFRPIEVTVRDTLAWWNTLPADRQARNRFVLTAEREAEILAAWKARR